MGERLHVALQEGLLPLGGERDVERPSRAGQPHHEQPALDHLPVEAGPELAEVDLGLRPWLMGLGHRHLDRAQSELGAAGGHVARHRHLRTRRAVLGDQPLPDPPGGVPLLARSRCVGEQPAVHDLHPRIHRRTRAAWVLLARRRQRRGQRLTHGAAMHPMPLRELTDRQALQPSVPTDPFEQLHP